MTVRSGYTVDQDDCWEIEPTVYDSATNKPFPKPTSEEEAKKLNKEMLMHYDEWVCTDCGGRILFDLDKDGFVHKEKRKMRVKV